VLPLLFTQTFDLPETSFAMTTQIAMELDIPVISSGVARTLDDISTLSNLPNISGAVVGRALFDEEIDLYSAIEIGSSKPTKAEFI